MASDRQQLIDLRRIAELEAKASGTDAISVKKEEPVSKTYTPTDVKTPSTARGMLDAAARGVTWGMSDIINAGIQAAVYTQRSDMTFGEAYNYARDRGELRREAFAEESPILSGVSEIVPAIVSGSGAAKLGAKAAPKLAAKVAAFGKAKPLRTAAGVSGASGGLYAAGTGRGDPLERAKQAALPAALSAGAGPLGVLAVRGGGTIASGVLSKFEKQAEKTLAKQAGRDPVVIEKPIQKVINKLRKDYPKEADFQKALQEYSEESGITLAEMGGKNVESLAKGVAQYPSGGAKTEIAIEKRLGGVPERLQDSISKYVHSSTSALESIDDVLEKGRAKASPLYKKAFDANKEGIVSKEIDLILETPAGRKALKKTVEIMRNNQKLMGLPDKELKAIQRDMTAIGKMDDVSGPIAKGLNLRTLDQVKKVLDNAVRKAGNKMGKDYDPLEEQGLIDLVGNFRTSLDKADKSGAYKAARQKAGDYLSTKSAIENGGKFMKSSAEVIKRQMKGMSASEIDAFKIGAAQRVRDGRVSELLDVSDFRVSQKVSEGQDMMGRLKAILKPGEFKEFQKAMVKEERLIKFRNKVLGGSPTTSKAVAAADFAENLGMDTMELAATGGIQAVPRRAVMSAIRNLKVGMTDKNAGKVADILYETDPAKKLKIMKQLTGTEGQKVIEATFEAMDSFRVYRIGKQALEESISPMAVGVATGITVGRQE